MHARLLFSVLLVLCVRSVSGVVIIAEGEISSSTIRSWLPVSSTVTRQDSEFQILDSLYSHGFFAAHVEITNDTIVVLSGEQFSFAYPRFLGDSVLLPQNVTDGLDRIRGSEFATWRIEEIAQELLTWFENNGHPFAQIEVDSLETDFLTQTVTPHLKVLAGPRISIEFIEFSGNTISQAKLLERESRLRIGSLYHNDKVKLARRRLAQLEYLRSVEEPRIVINAIGQSGLLFAVKENKLSRLDVVAGLSPKTDNSPQTVTGLIDLQFLNLFGTGRRGKVYWQRPSGVVQELALSWREAWIAGTPLHADVIFDQRVEDTLYVTRKYGLRVGIPLSASTEVFTGISREEALSDSLTAVALGFVTNQTLLAEVGLSVDTRDHSTNPRSGIRFETTAARGIRTTDVAPLGTTSTEFLQERGTLDVEANREVAPFWILHGSGHARALISDEPRIQITDLYKLGGARTLRGYSEEQFLGEQVIWTNIEARYWLGLASRIAFFTDWGAVFSEQERGDEMISTSVVEGSYGVGFRLETGIGVWGIDYGIATGNSPLNGQLHVSLLSLF